MFVDETHPAKPKRLGSLPSPRADVDDTRARTLRGAAVAPCVRHCRRSTTLRAPAANEVDDGGANERLPRMPTTSPGRPCRRHTAPRGSGRSGWRHSANAALTARAIADERAYSPMPNGPDTGTNKMRGLDSVKGGEPAIEHQKRPRPPKFAAHRAPQHAARDEPLHRLLQDAAGGA